MMIQAVLGNPNHPEYGVATIPFPIPHDQYAHCMELLEALEIGDAIKVDCKVEEVDSFFSVLKRTEMLTVNVEELNYLIYTACFAFILGLFPPEFCLNNHIIPPISMRLLWLPFITSSML